MKRLLAILKHRIAKAKAQRNCHHFYYLDNPDHTKTCVYCGKTITAKQYARRSAKALKKLDKGFNKALKRVQNLNYMLRLIRKKDCK
jgi:hypothetical protein